MNALVALYARYGIFGGLGAALLAGALLGGAIVLVRGRRRGVALPAVVGLCATGLVLGMMLFVDRARMQRAPGELVEAHFIGEGTGTMVLTVDRVAKVGLGHKKGWVYRLSSYSAVRGERTARTIVGEQQELIGAAGGRAWFRSEDLGVHARDPVTLDILITEKGLVDKNAALAGGFAHVAVDVDRRGLIVDTNTGQRMWIDGSTFAATPAAPSVAAAAPAPQSVGGVLVDDVSGAPIAIAAQVGEVVVAHLVGEAVVAATRERLVAVDRTTGEERWSTRF